MARQRYVVIGTHPESPTAVGMGTFYGYEEAVKVSGRMARKGWLTEIVPLLPASEIERVGPSTE